MRVGRRAEPVSSHRRRGSARGRGRRWLAQSLPHEAQPSPTPAASASARRAVASRPRRALGRTMLRQRHRQRSGSSTMPRAVVLSGVRTPIGRYGGGSAGTRPDDLAALAIRAAVDARRRAACARSRTSTSAARTRRARTTATSRAWPRSWPACRSPSPASPSTGSARRVSRRSSTRATRSIAGDGDLFVAGGVESHDAARRSSSAQAGEAFPRGDRQLLRHHARLALREPADGGAVPARVDGRDRRERRRALGHLAGGSGRFALALAAALGGRRRGRPLRRRARRRSATSRRRASAARHDAARSSPRSKPAFRAGGHRHRRQLVGHQRRRGRAS